MFFNVLVDFCGDFLLSEDLDERISVDRSNAGMREEPLQDRHALKDILQS